MTAPVAPPEPVSPQAVADRADPAPPARQRDRWIVPALLLLTVLAGVLRFTALDRPPIWGDESATYGRISGTHRELLDQLSDDSFFTPLHYELYWWIAQGMPYWGEFGNERTREVWKRGPDGLPVIPRVNEVRVVRDFVSTHRLVEGGIEMTPFMMRLIPALAGTLMVPAMYFLTRQLFGPRVSLLTALLVCFSAFLLVYSRDAKMYMHFWLMCVLNMGCFLWWLRARSLTSWLAWVASGLAMLGLHAPGAVLLGLQVLILVTAPRQHWYSFVRILIAIGWFLGLPLVIIYERLRQRFNLIAWVTPDRYVALARNIVRGFAWPPVIFFALGLWVIASPTLRYYSEFNSKSDEVVSDTRQFDMDRMGIGWVENYNRGRSLDDLLLYTTSTYLMSWEWPRYFVDGPGPKYDDKRYVPERTYKLLSGATIGLLSLLAIGLVPWRRLFCPARARLERMTQDSAVWPPFVRRRTLWVGTWLVVTAFAFYAASTARPAFVLDAVSTIALKSPPEVTWPRYLRKSSDVSTIDHLLTRDAWRPAFDAFETRLNPNDPLFISLDLLSRPDMRGKAGVSIRGRKALVEQRVRISPAGTVELPLLPNPIRLQGRTGQSAAYAIANAYRSNDLEVQGRVEVLLLEGAWSQAWQKYASGFTKENLATTRLAIVGVGVLALLGLLIWRRRSVWRTTARLAVATTVVLIAVGVITLLPRFADKSVWMPRYVAVLMPAFFITCAVLIARQPAWWLRGLTIGLFVIVNLSQYYGRVFTPTEPPTDRMAREVVDSQPKAVLASNPEQPTFRAYTNFQREEDVRQRFRGRGGDTYAGPEPAGGTLFTGPGSYYLRIYAKIPAPPAQVRWGSYHQNLRVWTDIQPDAIERDMKQSPQIERFTVWTGIDVNEIDLTDPIAERLKGSFRRVSDELIPVFDHWNWMRGGGHVNDERPRWNVRRREYVRIG